MVIAITPEEKLQMQQILLDEDLQAALKMIKVLHKRITEQANKGMKSHLDQ